MKLIQNMPRPKAKEVLLIIFLFTNYNSNLFEFTKSFFHFFVSEKKEEKKSKITKVENVDPNFDE